MSAKYDPIRYYGGTAYNPENTNRLNATTIPASLGEWSGPPWPKRVLSEEERASQGNRYASPQKPSLGYSTLVKSPQGASATENLWTAFNQSISAVPNFSDLVNSQVNAGKEITNRYGQTPTTDMLKPYEQSVRNLDQTLANITSGASDRYRGIVSGQQEALSQYEKDVLAAQTAAEAEAEAYKTGLSQDLINRATSARNRALSRYAVGANASGAATGPGTALDTAYGRAAAEAAAPYLQQAEAQKLSVMSRRPNILSDVYGNRYNLMGTNLGVEQNIYGAQAGVVNAQRATEADLLNRRQQLSQGAFDNAIRYAAANAQSAEQIARVTGLPIEDIMRRAQAVGALLTLENAALDRYIERPGGYNLLGATGFETPAYTGSSRYNFTPATPLIADSATTYPGIPWTGGVRGRYNPQGKSISVPVNQVIDPRYGTYSPSGGGAGSYSVNEDGGVNYFNGTGWETYSPYELGYI